MKGQDLLQIVGERESQWITLILEDGFELNCSTKRIEWFLGRRRSIHPPCPAFAASLNVIPAHLFSLFSHRCLHSIAAHRPVLSKHFFDHWPSHTPRLCHHRAGSRALIPPCRRQYTNSLVISAETVDAGLNENEPELAVLVLAIALEVLAHGDGLLDQHVEIFWDFGGEA